jgi:tetratricopeptide (TPR) repeat protein
MTTAAPTVSNRPLRWVVLLALAGAAVVGVERTLAPDAPPLPAPPAPLAAPALVAAPTGAAKSYVEAKAKADIAVMSADERARAAGDQWLVLEALATAYMNRGRLTGSFDDYAAAQAALDRAFAVADPGTGPHLTQAALDFAMHRLARAERQLAAVERYAVPPDPGDRAEVMLIRGDIAFYRGKPSAALALYAQARAIDPYAGVDFRRAVHASRTGDVDLAKSLFDRAEATARRPTPQARANLELQRGVLELERGRHLPALAHFRRAEAIFPGWWLIEEHIAEVTALNGQADEAERLYRDIVRRTGNPEFMDALAGLARARGDAAGAAAWTRRARPLWERRLAQFPEAAYGHAIGHFADSGDTRRALDLARRNATARPYGDAQVELAAALLAAGRPAEAKPIIDAVLRSPWRTPMLHATASNVYAALRLPGPALAQRRLALAANPHAFD